MLLTAVVLNDKVAVSSYVPIVSVSATVHLLSLTAVELITLSVQEYA